MFVTTFIIGIMQLHNNSAWDSHLPPPYFTQLLRHIFLLLQQFYDAFAICGFCVIILFVVIQKKGVNTQHDISAIMVLITLLSVFFPAKVLWWNIFNKHRYISAIVTRFNLACKISYNSLGIFTKTKQKLKISTTFNAS